MTRRGDDLPEGEGPEGSGWVPDPEDAAQNAVLRHVLDAVRGDDTPDVVPAGSSVAGFAEFLAVEAVLDKRWPETRMEPSLDRIADLVDLLGDRALLADADVQADVHEMLLTRCLSIAGGTTQILLNVAAEMLLGLPR